ncbi:hypothetical protein U9M48_003819 [Paspalum notatum var. saurae]|uniref:Uncharacterized protein n=1 Tax=Paspalum notatum var. saurae TaxID=547442 RepID=A0AAQ3PJI4_PASNO
MAPLTSLNLPHHESPWNRKQQQYRTSSSAHHRVYSAAATNPMLFAPSINVCEEQQKYSLRKANVGLKEYK